MKVSYPPTSPEESHLFLNYSGFTQLSNSSVMTPPSVLLPDLFNQSLQFNQIFNMSWGRFLMPCQNWQEPQHLLFQLASGCYFISCLSPDNSTGILVMHLALMLGGLLYSAWAWNVMTAPNIFSWTFGFTFLNFCHVLYDIYRMRPVRIDPELEPAFNVLFRPLGISRKIFKKLVSPEYAEIFSLHPGEAYALQNLTRTGRLSLLVSGKAQVMSDRTTLHTIEANEFLDSPEFESSRASLEDKFRVSIFATTHCRYISWQRSSLEYLFVKETVLANVFGVLVARDVINKVYSMSRKLASHKGVFFDIRLPSLSSCLLPSPKERSSPNFAEKRSPSKICTANGIKRDSSSIILEINSNRHYPLST